MTRSEYVANLDMQAAYVSRVATRHASQRVCDVVTPCVASRGNQGMLRCLFFAAIIGFLLSFTI